MTLTRSLPTQHASGLPLIDERRITQGRFVRNTDGTARVGVLPSHSSPLVTGRASMGYDVAPFNAVTARTSAGAEEIANDGSVTVTTTAAPGSNSRIDVIWVRAQFQVLGDANNDVVFGVTQGTAAVSPLKPAIPAGALELATATIPSTATTTLSSGVVITQTHPYTAAAGGVVPFRSFTEMTAWAAPAGTMARDLTSGVLFQRGASAWASASGLQLLQRIDFTAASAVVFAGFTEAFENYYAKLEINTSSNPGGSGGSLQLRAGGVNNAAAQYTVTQEIVNNATPTGPRTPNLTSFPMLPLVAVEHSLDIEFSRPAIVAATRIKVDAQSVLDPSTNWGSKMWGRHNVAAAFDGFSYAPSAGTISGSLWVYGRA